MLEMGKRRVPTVSADEPADSLLGKAIEAELDLHGADTASAGKQLEFFLDRLSRTRPGSVVRVITGKGNRSGEGPVLRPLVARLLAGPLARYVARHTMDSAGGAFLIQVP